MENILSRANQLLQNGAPEQALLLLNEQNNSTSECEQLKSVCKRALSEQYLWLLNDAAKNNRKDEIKAYVNRYHNLIGHDDNVAKYEAMLPLEYSNPQSQNNYKNYQSKMKYNFVRDTGELAIYPFVLLLMGLLAIFHDLFTDFSDSIDNTIYRLSTVLYCVFIIYAIIIFFTIDNKVRPPFKHGIIPLFWGLASILTSISSLGGRNPFTHFREGHRFSYLHYFNLYHYDYNDFCDYEWCPAVYLIVLLIACGLMIFFLISKIKKSASYKIPFVIAIVAMICEIVCCSLDLYKFHYIRINDFYLELFNWRLRNVSLISNIVNYGGKIFMAAAFLLFYLTSKKLTQKNSYGTN